MFTQIIIKKSSAVLLALMLVASPITEVFAAEEAPATGESSCSVTVVSDSSTQGGVATPVNSGWASIPGATWIWGTSEVTDSRVQETNEFTKNFNWSGPVVDANLELAADNGYSVTLNGEAISSSDSEFNYSPTVNFDVASKIKPGVNTLNFTVTNLPVPSENNDPQGNPAGLIYKLVANGSNATCDQLPAPTGTIQITKYMCPASTTVTRTNNGVGKSVPQGCELQENAYFSYVSGTQTDANSPFPELDSAFTSLGVTDSNGVTSLELPATGRYLISETDSANAKLANSSVLGLYCEGDGDTSDNNDNQELTFVSKDKTTKCVAYNPEVTGGEGTDPQTPTYVIDGYKFNDVDQDGSRDENESGIAGWTIKLINNGAETEMTTTTDANGYYSFNVAAGNYTVEEVQQTGWEQTATIGTGADGDKCYFTVGQESLRTIAINTNQCDFGNHLIEQNECRVSSNLLENGSFEVPNIESEQGWDIFDSIVNGLAWAVSWINPSENAPEIAKLELQNGRAASEGSQYAELDSNFTHPGEATMLGDARVKISQTINTVIGNEYTLTYDFSAIPGHGRAANNIVNVMVNGVVVDTQSTSLPSGATSTNWTQKTFTFVASTTSTEIALADGGRSNTFGTLIDNVSLTTCATNNGGGDGDDTDRDVYRIQGNVWLDQDQSGTDIDESGISSWTITITNGSTTLTTSTDANGDYSFDVVAGTWTITQETRDGYTPTFPVANQYVVTVPIDEPVVMSFVNTVMNALLPTAMAADTVLATYTGYNFGDYQSPSSSRGGSRSGSKRTGQVLGDSTSIANAPAGEVLGAATSTMPVGAPATGAGGTSASLTDSTTVAIFVSNKLTNKKKNA